MKFWIVLYSGDMESVDQFGGLRYASVFTLKRISEFHQYVATNSTGMLKLQIFFHAETWNSCEKNQRQKVFNLEGVCVLEMFCKIHSHKLK